MKLRHGSLLALLVAASTLLPGIPGSHAMAATAPSPLPPQGLYESCVFNTSTTLTQCDAHLDRMAAAGFKIVMNYDALYAPIANLRAYAAHANSVGMKVMWPLNDSVWWTGRAKAVFTDLAATCNCRGNAAFARYIVGALKGLPGTWGYYVGDELDPSELAAAQIHWTTVHTADAAKPTVLVSAEDEGTLGTGMLPFAAAAGVTTLAPDIYPIGRYANPADDPISSVGTSVAYVSHLAAANSQSAGAVLQAFDWKKMYPTETWLAVARFPTATEMRAMRDGALAAGNLSFIMWYSYFDLMNDTPWQQHWSDLTWAAFGP